jgi:hypothetical protein
MSTTSRKDYDGSLAEWLAGVRAEQAGHHLRFIVISDDADTDALDAAITVLVIKKGRACIPSTADEIQADIDELLERRHMLAVG